MAAAAQATSSNGSSSWSDGKEAVRGRAAWLIVPLTGFRVRSDFEVEVESDLTSGCVGRRAESAHTGNVKMKAHV